jgi:pre-mRNA-splicing factor 18
MKRLRLRREPITLFGESDIQRAERLRKLELKTPIEYIQSDGSEFLKIIREEEDKEDQDEGIEAQLQRVQDEDPDFKKEDRPATCIEEEILFFFRKAWWEWHDELDRRPETERRTAQGRHDTATLKQTRAFLKPLFKLLQKRALGSDILKEIIQIYKHCATADYVAANDAYYRLAIGNAPWPMGVTMVGIHERSSREKLHSSSVAHVLNDETQRKYIQGVKRLMSFLQKKYPTAPSKSVN